MRSTLKSVAIVAALLCSIPVLAGAQKLVGAKPGKTIPPPVVLDNQGKFNSRFASVGEDLYIAGQPTEVALRELRKLGVTTIVNLRTPPEMQKEVPFDEPTLAASLGMKYVYLPVRGNAEFPYAPSTVDKFAEAMTKADGKVLLHCTVAWRASHLWAAYLITKRGMSVDSALASARLVNLMDDMHDSPGRQPVEEFLNRDLPQLHGVKKKS